MSNERSTAGPMTFDRLSTGIPAMDEILGGGIPKNSVNIIMGHPGTGKTIFAEQLVFHNARGATDDNADTPRDDRPILYMTTLSEPLSKVVTYLQGFSFFDADKLTGGVVYEDIGAELASNGPQYIVDRVREAIQDYGPKVIVIDSFKVLHDLSDSVADMRRTISDLAGLLSAYDATVFLIGEYAEDQIQLLPEFAVADGIIEFARRGNAKRDERFVRVVKLRGSAYAEGLHAFRITTGGLDVYPRLVTPSVPIDYDGVREKILTGITGLDEILDGGLWRGSTLLVTGQAGTGKTTLGLQFAIAGVLAGERSLYLNFQENPTQLARTIAALGHDLDDLRRRGLRLQYESPVELRIDSVVVDVFHRVHKHGIDRVVIDALGDLALAAGDLDRFHDYLYSLCQHMIVNGTTTLMTMEILPEGQAAKSDDRFSSMADALIELRLEMSAKPQRTLRVVKARGIAHDLRVQRMVMESGGARITGPVES